MSTPSPTLLVINTGSSSVKFQLFKPDSNELTLLAKGMIQEIGSAPVFNAMNYTQSFEFKASHPPSDLQQKITVRAPLICRDAAPSPRVRGEGKKEGSYVEEPSPSANNHENAIRCILNWLEAQHLTDSLMAVAHRVVHGGSMFQQSVIVTPEIISSLKSLCPFAPLHQPHNLKGIEIIQELKPNIPQIACFDTAFHAQHTPLFTHYALPESIRALGIRRYGFHGLSYEWIVHQLRTNNDPLANQRIVVAHLGNGSSLCAIHAGVSVDTTMGFTALDGLPMGTRCGSLDPGVIIYLARDIGLSMDEIENILYTESGLKGLSNATNDVRLLQESDDQNARFALDYFCLKTAQMISMMMISLGSMDGLIFTGGIGENATLIREKIIAHLHCLKPFETRIIPTNEEKIMAIQAMKLTNLFQNSL